MQVFGELIMGCGGDLLNNEAVYLVEPRNGGSDGWNWQGSSTC